MPVREEAACRSHGVRTGDVLVEVFFEENQTLLSFGLLWVLWLLGIYS